MGQGEGAKGARRRPGAGICLFRVVPFPLFSFLLALFLPRPALAQPTLTGYTEAYAAVRAFEDGDVLAARTRARLDLDGAFTGGAYTIRNEVTYDVPGDRLQYDLREAFLDVFGERLDVRVGRQILAWGETDGAFITDVLSPLDLSEFLTQPQDRLRLGVPAVRAAAYLGPVTAEGVWVPVSPVSTLPAEDGPWNPAPDAVLGIPVVRTPPDRPAAQLATSEAAARLTWAGLPLTDLALVLHDGTNRVPGFAKRLALEHLEGPRIEVTPTYRRRTLIGLTAETAALSPFVLRAEAAYETRALFDERLPPITSVFDLPLLEPGLARGFLVERPRVQAAVTAERVIGTNLLRLTGLGRWVLDHDDTVAAEAVQPAVTALWNGTFRRETLTARAFAFWNVGADLWLNPSLTVAVRDALNLEVGGQLFEDLADDEDDGPLGTLAADPSGAFALFDANDLVYARLRYSF